METKICSCCKVEKGIAEFRFRNKAKGLLHRSCKDCTKQQFKTHYAKNKDKVIQQQLVRGKRNRSRYYEFKTTLECVSCGESAPYCLDFHHLDGTDKQYAIAKITDINWGTLIRELRKCVCLCANCHRKVHAGDLVVEDNWLTGPRSLMDKALAFEASK